MVCNGTSHKCVALLKKKNKSISYERKSNRVQSIHAGTTVHYSTLPFSIAERFNFINKRKSITPFSTPNYWHIAYVRKGGRLTGSYKRNPHFCTSCKLQMDLNTFQLVNMTALTSCKYFILNSRDNFMSARATGTLASALVSAAMSQHRFARWMS